MVDRVNTLRSDLHGTTVHTFVLDWPCAFVGTGAGVVTVLPKPTVAVPDGELIMLLCQDDDNL